jgi:hypothetical protein
MASRREDYLLRLIEELREFVAQAVALRDTGRLNQALMTVVTAQEKLFARPAAEFAPLGIDEQLRLLLIDESADTGRGKCLAYASILHEAGNVYQARGREDLSASAFQLALYVTLSVALGDDAKAGELRQPIEALRARLKADSIQGPVREMLERFEGAAGVGQNPA